MHQRSLFPHLEYEIPVLLGLQEGVSVRDGIADDEALAAAHVLLPHRSELHLASGVEDVWNCYVGLGHTHGLHRRCVKP